ncbi:Coiled-coil domain-containing protein 65, partial [Intoshia linei]
MARKKADKLAKMTEEEKLLYLDQQKAAEEEMARKKEDLLIEFLRDKLEKEMKATKFNMNKLNHQWRNVMRDLKSKELKREIEILSQSFERVIDRKDSIIKTLMETIVESVTQVYTALSSHNHNIRWLNEIHHGRLHGINIEFEDKKMNLIHQCDKEMNTLRIIFQDDVNNLQDINFSMEQKFTIKNDNSKKEFINYLDEIKSKALEEKHASKIALEMSINDLWNQYLHVSKEYKESTNDRRKLFEALKTKDEKSAIEMESQMQKIQFISDNIQQLRLKMQMNSKEADQHNRSIKDKRDTMTKQFHMLKSKMNITRNKAQRDMKCLVLKGNETVEELKTVCNQVHFLRSTFPMVDVPSFIVSNSGFQAGHVKLPCLRVNLKARDSYFMGEENINNVQLVPLHTKLGLV